jgi:hypothetical protein
LSDKCQIFRSSLSLDDLLILHHFSLDRSGGGH